MQARIADELVRSDLPEQIKLAIQDAITLWEAERFAFNQKRFLLHTVVGQDYYALDDTTLRTSADAAVDAGVRVIELDTIAALDSSGAPYKLVARSQQWVEDHSAAAGAYSGSPTDYTVYGDELRIFPVPNVVRTIRISALARLATLTNEGDTNQWMTDGEMLIRPQAKLFLYLHHIEDDVGEAKNNTALAAAQWSMKRKMSAKARTGAIRPWNL
jgi:hypothetical protein